MVARQWQVNNCVPNVETFEPAIFTTVGMLSRPPSVWVTRSGRLKMWWWGRMPRLGVVEIGIVGISVTVPGAKLFHSVWVIRLTLQKNKLFSNVCVYLPALVSEYRVLQLTYVQQNDFVLVKPITTHQRLDVATGIENLSLCMNLTMILRRRHISPQKVRKKVCDVLIRLPLHQLTEQGRESTAPPRSRSPRMF